MTRTDDVVLILLRIDHTFLTHWVFFLLKSEPRPECVPCQCPLTVKRLLLECVDTGLARDHFYKVTTLKDVFNDISCETAGLSDGGQAV